MDDILSNNKTQLKNTCLGYVDESTTYYDDVVMFNKPTIPHPKMMTITNTPKGKNKVAHEPVVLAQ